MNQTQHRDRILDRLSDYSDESLLNELRRVAKDIGKTSLTLEDFEKYGRCSYAILKQRFGGLRAAQKAAGLSAEDFHRNVPDDELLGELARIWDLVLTHEGRRPYKDDLVKYKSKFSQGPYYRRWKSWIKACEAMLDWEATNAPKAISAKVESERPHRSTPKRKRPIPLRIRYAILLRDHWTCKICGRSSPSVEVDVDHIISEFDGGTLEPANLRCLCRDCNLGKGHYSESGEGETGRDA